jgi:hypothetical protein
MVRAVPLDQLQIGAGGRVAGVAGVAGVVVGQEQPAAAQVTPAAARDAAGVQGEQDVEAGVAPRPRLGEVLRDEAQAGRLAAGSPPGDEASRAARRR